MSRLKITLWAVIAGLIATIGWLAFDHRTQVESTAASMMKSTIAPLVQQFPLMQFGTLSEPTTLLFMGTDVVYEHEGKRVEPEPASYRGNSDSMMCIRLDPINDRLVVLQIPRDTEVMIGGRVRKVNSANPIGGPAFAEQTVSELLGCPIDHYVVMNVHGIVDLFNEVGGITVHVPKPMQYMDWTAKLKIDLEPGYHTLTGNQAMGFVRFRHDALGDIGRLQRQQIFIDACFRKVMDPGSWLHAPAVMDIIQKNINTDLSSGDLLKVANFVHSVPRNNVVMVVLPGRFAGNGDWIANADVKNVVTRLLDPSQDIAACRRNISIFVENGTPVPGFAWKLAVALRKLGYLVSVGGKSGEPADKTKIIAQVGNGADARMIREDLAGAGEVVNASLGNMGTSITIIAGSDIVLDKICKSCPDAPYVAPVAALPSLQTGRSSESESQAEGTTELGLPGSGADNAIGTAGDAAAREGQPALENQDNAKNGLPQGFTAIEGDGVAPGTILNREQRSELDPSSHDKEPAGTPEQPGQRQGLLEQEPVSNDLRLEGTPVRERRREASAQDEPGPQGKLPARDPAAASDAHEPPNASARQDATSAPGSSGSPDGAPLAPEGFK